MLSFTQQIITMNIDLKSVPKYPPIQWEKKLSFQNSLVEIYGMFGPLYILLAQEALNTIWNFIWY